MEMADPLKFIHLFLEVTMADAEKICFQNGKKKMITKIIVCDESVLRIMTKRDVQFVWIIYVLKLFYHYTLIISLYTNFRVQLHRFLHHFYWEKLA